MNKPSVWVIAGTRAGQRNSCYGVAAKINPSYEVIKIREVEAAGSLEAYLNEKYGENVPYPDLVISTGRIEDKTSPLMIDLKKLSGGKTTTLQINYPSRELSLHFDIVAAERSADFRLVKNRIDITGVPHKITRELIKTNAEKPEFRAVFELMNNPGKPVFLAMIGGDINANFQLTVDEARKAGKRIREVVEKHDGYLCVTNSPRITVEAWRAMREELEPVCWYVYDCRETSIRNPLMAMLGQRGLSATFVTGDSISMCCEANITGMPVYIMDLPGLKNDYYSLIHADLYKQGFARPFEEIETNGLDTSWFIKEPLDEAQKVADFAVQFIDAKKCRDRRDLTKNDYADSGLGENELGMLNAMWNAATEMLIGLKVGAANFGDIFGNSSGYATAYIQMGSWQSLQNLAKSPLVFREEVVGSVSEVLCARQLANIFEAHSYWQSGTEVMQEAYENIRQPGDVELQEGYDLVKAYTEIFCAKKAVEYAIAKGIDFSKGI